MTRSVQCSDNIGNVVEDEKCSADIKPVDKMQCRGNSDHCKLLWQYSSWSEVSDQTKMVNWCVYVCEDTIYLSTHILSYR